MLFLKIIALENQWIAFYGLFMNKHYAYFMKAVASCFYGFVFIFN